MKVMELKFKLKKRIPQVSSSMQPLQKPLTKRTSKWVGICLLAMAATRIYYVQEMIAALVIFSVLFLAVAMMALVVFLLDRASKNIVAWAEVAVVRVGHWAACRVEDVVVWPLWARLASRCLKQHTGNK